MDEMIQRENRRQWISRILMTIDIILICAGYITWFQAKRQLISPLIPRSTIYTIMADSGDEIFKVSIVCALIFLGGLWFYSFKKTSIANIFFLAVTIVFLLFQFLPGYFNPLS